METYTVVSGWTILTSELDKVSRIIAHNHGLTQTTYHDNDPVRVKTAIIADIGLIPDTNCPNVFRNHTEDFTVIRTGGYQLLFSVTHKRVYVNIADHFFDDGVIPNLYEKLP